MTAIKDMSGEDVQALLRRSPAARELFSHAAAAGDQQAARHLERARTSRPRTNRASSPCPCGCGMRGLSAEQLRTHTAHPHPPVSRGVDGGVRFTGGPSTTVRP